MRHPSTCHPGWVPSQCWCPPQCPAGLLYSVEVDAILTRFHGKSLLWPESPGLPTEEQVSTDYEDGYRGEQWARGSPAPQSARAVAQWGSPVPVSLQGTRWPRANSMTIPKPKVRLAGGREWVLGTPGLQGALPSQGLWVVPAQESCPSLCPHAHPSAVVGALRALVPRRVRGGGPQQKQHKGRGEWCPAAWGCLVVGTPLWPGTLGWHPRTGTGTGPDAALGRWRSSVWG